MELKMNRVTVYVAKLMNREGKITRIMSTRDRDQAVHWLNNPLDLVPHPMSYAADHKIEGETIEITVHDMVTVTGPSRPFDPEGTR